MTPAAPAEGGRLVRNTALNGLGQVLPGLAALVSIPLLIRGLGVERFGVLSLALVVLGFLSLFDLGLGRATIKFVAEAIGRQQEARVPRILGTALATQAILGPVGAVLLAALTPLLVGAVIRVPPAIAGEARAVFYLLALCLPFVIWTASLKGLLEAYQRFDVVNTVRSLFGAAMFLAPALVVTRGGGLQGAMLALAAAVAGTALAYLALDLVLFPGLGRSVGVDGALFRALFGFGGWVTVSNLVIPTIVYADRVLLSVLSGVGALTYYVVPYELVGRLQVIPWSFGTALFPAFSTAAAGQQHELGRLYAQSTKYLLVVISTMALGLLLAARPILQLWLGVEFAQRGALVMQLLAVGMLLNALSQVPSQLLDSVGRPDLRAKVFLLYMPGYLLGAGLLIWSLGAVGAALAWMLRGALELCLFFGVSWRWLGLGPRPFLENRALAGLAAFGALALLGGLGLNLVQLPPLAVGLAAVVIVAAFGAALWGGVLFAPERRQVLALVARRAALSSPAGAER